jgi:hypothetical protein
MSSTSRTFEELYAYGSSNPLGKTEGEVREAYRVIYGTWRSENATLTIEDIEEEILTDFISPLGDIGMMVASEGSKMGRFKLTQGHERYPGVPGKAHQERRTIFAWTGDVDGMDAFTFTVDKHQWGLTPYVNVPRTLDRYLTLLEGAPTADMVGPFEDDTTDLHTIHTCSSMFVPFELVFPPLYLTTFSTALSLFHTVVFMIAAPNSVAFSVISSCAHLLYRLPSSGSLMFNGPQLVPYS